MGGGGGTKYKAKEHPEERELAKIAKEQWEDYRSRYIPIENEWMSNVSTLNNEGSHSAVRGMAASEFAHSNQDMLDQMRGATGGGDGYRKADLTPIFNKTANNLSQIKNKASLGVTDRYVRGMENIIGIGQGQQTEGLQGMTDVAEQAVQGRIENSKNRFKRDQGTLDGFGSMAGAATAYGLGKRGKS
mgnify:CR=1 FL=1